MYNPFKRYRVYLCRIMLLSLMPQAGVLSAEALSFHHAQTPFGREDSHASE